MVFSEQISKTSGVNNGSFNATDGKEYIFVYGKDGSVDGNSDNATITFSNENFNILVNTGVKDTEWGDSTGAADTAASTLLSSATVINWNNNSMTSKNIKFSRLQDAYVDSSITSATGNTAIQSGLTNTKLSNFRNAAIVGGTVPGGSNAIPLSGLRSTAFGTSGSYAWVSGVGLLNDYSSDDPATGSHSSYSFLKVSIDESLTGSSTVQITWAVSSEGNYDFLWIYHD